MIDYLTMTRLIALFTLLSIVFAPNVKIDKKTFIDFERKVTLEREKRKKVVKKTFSLDRITFYTLSKRETDNDPFTASCGPIREVKDTIIALSRDLFFSNGKKICGQKVKLYLSNDEVIEGIVYDTMHARYKRSADVLVESRQKALELGVKSGVLEFLE